MLKTAWMKLIETAISATPDFRGKGWLFQFPTRLVVDEPIRTAYGVKLKCRLHDYTNRASVFGHYGQDVAAAIRQMPAGSAFIDIGGNAGLFSSIAAQTVGADGIVIAFEPQPELCRLLSENVRLNGAQRVLVFNLAVAEQGGELTMSRYNPRHSGLAHLDDEDGGQIVRAVNIDTDLPVVQKAISNRHTVVKIDVEGAELQALRGMKTIVAAPSTRTVIVEIDRAHLARFDTTPDEIYRLMKELGFRPTSPSQFTLDHYDEIFQRD